MLYPISKFGKVRSNYEEAPVEILVISEFFDRDAKASYADQMMPVLDEFIRNNDISKPQSSLESIRLIEFPESVQQ